MIRKTILALILLLTAASAAMAGSKYLYVSDIDGGTVAVKIEDDMMCEVHCPETGDVRPYSIYIYGSSGEYVLLGDASSKFVENDHLSREMPFSQLKSLSLTDAAGVEGANALSIKIDITNSTVTLTGLAEPINVSVCSADGKVLMNESVTDGTSLDLSQLGHGLMIVTVGTKTFKIFVP